ncbi:MAG: hypothetical protein Q7T74_02520, partial [Candidatus Saccharibacteria bacterium]|nr:hypothetical protein [Candidatus Saccharibacteria bacterium]
MPLFILAVSLLSFVLPSSVEQANAATSSTLSFQGRLLTNSGTLVPDGSYNIEFKLYNASAIDGGESLVQGACQTNPGPIADEDCLWVESRTGVNTVTVQNGYFSVNLGSVTAFPGTINWDQELWLGMNIGGVGAPTWDGEMTPRFKLTAVPYAFRAGALVDASGNAKTADDLAQLAPGSVQTVNAAIAALRLNQTGAGSLLQLQGNGSDVFTVDKNGNAVLGAGITLGNSSATTAGTIRWNGSAFQGYNGSSWTSLGSSAVMPFVSKTKIVSETQNIVINPTATLQSDDELSFSIGANETWNYRFLLHISMNATPDIKFSVSAPVGATCVNGVSDFENAISVANLACGASSGNIAGLTATDVYEVSGSITNGANAGTVTLNWAQNTANAANTIVLAGSFVEASRSVGGSSADVAYIQDGNSFGGLAVLGTNDANGLALETNGVERIQIQSGGDIQAKDDFIANRTATGVTGTTSGSGTNTTTLTLAADSFSVNDVVFIDNAAQDYYTRITVDPGTGSYTVSPAVTFTNARTVTKYTIQNIGAITTDYSNQANRFFQGYFLGGVVIGAGSTTIGDGSIESTTALNIQSGGGDVNIGGALVVTGAITGDGSGITNIDGAGITGSTITGLNGSNISSGTVNDLRLSSNVTLLGNTFNGVSQLVQLDGSGNLPGLNGSALTSLSAGNLTGALAALDGSALTSLNATNISSGTLADGRLSANVALLTGVQTFSGAKTFSSGLTVSSGDIAVSSGDITASGAISGATISGDGSALISLNATNISSGTINDLRLSGNVTLLGNTFNGSNQLVRLDGSGNLPALNGAALTSLSAGNLTGTLAALDGSALTNLNGSNIASGTVADARLSANVTVLGNTFNGANQLVRLDVSGNLPVINGAALTNLNA